MKNFIRKCAWVFLAVTLCLLLLWVFSARRQGGLENLNLGSGKIEKATCVTLQNAGFKLVFRKNKNGVWTAHSSLGNFTPDGSKIEDFLHVLNLWEPEEIVAAQSVNAPVDTWRIAVKRNRKTLYRQQGFYCNSDFYLKSGRGELCKMMCSWQRSTWKDYFQPDISIWRNRLLIDLDYFEIASVTAGNRTYTAGPENDRYFSAFKQVYFDIPARPLCPGDSVTCLSVQTKRNQTYSFKILSKLQPDGSPDPFKAYVVTAPSPAAPADTVEVPYVALDKLL